MTTPDPEAARAAMIARQHAQSGAYFSRRSDAEPGATLGLGPASVQRIADDIGAERKRLLAEARALIDGFSPRRTDSPASPDPVAEARARMVERDRRASLGLPPESPRADAAPSTLPARETGSAPDPFAGGLPPEVERARKVMLDKMAESRRTDGPPPAVRTIRTDVSTGTGIAAGPIRFAAHGEAGSL